MRLDGAVRDANALHMVMLERVRQKCDDEEFDVIPAAELELTKNAMNLTELKTRPPADLVELAESMGLENLARSRKQDIIFSILKAHAKNG